MAGEYEELFADLDRQFRELKANHEVVVAERDQLRTALGMCEEQRAALTAEVQTLTTRLDEAAAAARRMELAANSAKQERDSFASAADIKQGEIDRLNEELRQRNERVAAAMEREGKTFAELSKAQAEVRPLQLQVARLQEERDLLARQRQELEGEAQRQQAALLEQRRAAAAEKVRARA
jgi:chromosome segregation ATPase